MARPQPHPSPVRTRFAEYDLDEANACLSRNGEPVALAPTPFTLLCVLAGNPGALLTKDALLDAVWGHRFVSESVLKTAISDLRTALGDDARQPRFIETVARRGYRFVATPSDTPDAASLQPVPAMGSALPAPATFIGRTGEIARLRRAWERACGGQRSMVWVAGEPGIGKTTLIDQFVAGLGDVACARGHCVEHYGTGEPYLPVLEALADLCRRDASMPGLLRTVAPTWLLQLPWLSTAEERDALRRELAGVGPERMLREMGELFDRYTAQRPLLLVTEDLHWSDRSTIQLIDFLARRRGQPRLMWLASFRVTEVVALDHPLNALRHELRLQRLCEEVVLDPFSETEVADFVARHSARLARDEAFVRALHERTDGVPLFVSSVIGEVLERSDDDEAVEARLAHVAVPENLAAIIDHYIARLGHEQRTVLSAAAVCGVAFRVETVSMALEQDLPAAAILCEALVREQLWLTHSRADEGDAAGPCYAFRHALFRQVLYDRTPPSLRPHLHHRVGVALESERSAGIPVSATELAMHFERGRQPASALRYYAEAAETALLHFSPAACLEFTERAATLLPQAPGGPERDAVEFTLATLQGMAAFHTLGVGRKTLDPFERAYALLAQVPGHPMHGRLLHGFGQALSLRGEYEPALEVAARAEALAAESGDAGLRVAACIVQGEVHHLRGRTSAARAWLERGLAIAEPLGIASNEMFTTDPQCTLLARLAIELLRCGLVRQGRDHLERARDRALALRQPMTRLYVLWQEILFEVRLDAVERVAVLATEMQALVDEFAPALGRMACRWWRGWVAARRGSAMEGVRLIQQAYDEHAAFGMRAGSSEVLGYAAEGLLLAGRLEDAHQQLRQALEVADALREGVYLPQLWLLDATLARASGAPEAGSTSVRRALDEARAQQAPWMELLALTDLCEHHDATPAERTALAALVEQLPETADTDLGHRAQAVLRSI